MKTPQSFFTAVAALILSGNTGMALAEPATLHHEPAMQIAGNQTVHEGRGLLKAINLKDSKVQIAHEAIASLQWPPMTMWFALRAPLPAKIKVGDQVRFEIMQADGKSWEVTRVEPR